MFTEVQVFTPVLGFPVVDMINQELVGERGEVEAVRQIPQVINDQSYIEKSKTYDYITLKQSIEAGLQNSKVPTDVLSVSRIDAVRVNNDAVASKYLQAALKSNLLENNE